jgi:hypothetical protein
MTDAIINVVNTGRRIQISEMFMVLLPDPFSPTVSV